MPLPQSMHCVEISQPGGPEVLKLTRRSLPRAGLGEVLLAVQAAGVNRPDCLQRAGFYPAPPGATDIPGLEVAGTVVALGPGVTQWQVGDLVCALVTGGGYAEFCVAAAALCLPIPAGFDPSLAAAIPETLFTVWSNVFDRAALQPGETLLVQGGASGIGTTAIQLAHALGHRVFATAGTPEKCATCVRLGAERAIHYRSEDFVSVVKEATADRGVDVILDMVGGDYVAREINALADDGRLVLIAFLGGSKSEMDLAQVMRRRLHITGSTLRPRPVAFKAAIAAQLYARVWPLLESGAIRPLIHAIFPLSQASDAHALMESGSHMGKIVLGTEATW